MSRRANGEGSIYQRKDGRWTGAVYVLNRDGGRQRRQVYGRTRAEVAGKVADLLSLNRKHIPAAPVEVTLQQYAQSWLKRLGSSGLKPATVSNYRWVLDRHVLPDELPETVAQRPLRRRARQRQLRGRAGYALRLGQGVGRLA